MVLEWEEGGTLSFERKADFTAVSIVTAVSVVTVLPVFTSRQEAQQQR